jgi:mycofactocin system glycosyltransferase
VDYGLLHPIGNQAASTHGRVTFVVPAKNSAAMIEPLVRVLIPHAPVIVVDDYSTDETATSAAAAGARVVHSLHPGPAGARNTGLAVVETDLVAFIDSDCVPTARWLEPLVDLLEDPRIALVGPRVASLDGAPALARYETCCSPLDLGRHGTLVAPGRRLSYLPSAALVGRRAAIAAIGGFDPSLRVGEDVDLVLRMQAAGHLVRYAPESVVWHRPRASIVGLVRQRFAYGTSAAMLERLHPGFTTPLHLSRGTTAVWSACLIDRQAGLLMAAGATLLAALTARDPKARWHAARIAGLGHLFGTRQLARGCTRVATGGASRVHTQRGRTALDCRCLCR